METESLSSGDPLSWGFHLQPLTEVNLAGLAVVALLLVLSALISGSEVAYFSLGPGDKKKLTKNRLDQKVLQNLQNPEKLLATILVSNNFVNIAIIITGAYTGRLILDRKSVV